MKLKVLAVGKMKNRPLAEVTQDFSHRIARLFPSFEMIEVPDEAIREKIQTEILLEKEGRRLEKKLKLGAYRVALDEAGKQWTSVELAQELKRLFESPHKEIVFLIGGPHGLAASLKERCQSRWSLSKLTLPHQLARVLTLEQLYRALTILKNVPYHNE